MEDDLDLMERIDEFDFSFDVPDVEIQYQETTEDEGCEGGACKI